MRFNDKETQLLLLILKNIKSNSSIDLLIEKIGENEYIKGRLLNQLFLELTKAEYTCDDSQNVLLQALLKKIKFKATPR